MGSSSELTYRWRKSSYSGQDGQCVELASTGAVRDSKNPTGPVLTVALPALLRHLKSGR